MTRVIFADGSMKVANVEPFCNYFERCGGCSYQHWDETEYRSWKRGKVIAALARQSIDSSVAETVDAHGAGRRRVSLHVRKIDATWHAGFMAAKSHDLVTLDACPVLAPRLQLAPVVAADFGPTLGNCDVAVTLADQGLDVAIRAERSAGTKRLPHLQELFQKHRLCRLSVNGEAVFTQGTPMIAMGNARVPLPVESFLQATQAGEDALASVVAAILKKSKLIVDLFCGIGPFAIRLAQKAHVHAIDMDARAIACLTSAVNSTQGLKPITAETRDLFRNPAVHQELNEFDGIVLDPPRAGAEAQCRAIGKSKVKRVAYVSCDTVSFARDARILTDAGYQLKQVTPVDQFKWTAHIEMVGEFVR